MTQEKGKGLDLPERVRKNLADQGAEPGEMLDFARVRECSSIERR